jgi:two-component system OmpR family sensor kinase
LILALTTVLVVSWLAAIGLSFRVMQHEFDEIFDAAQQETTERLLALILAELNQGTDRDPRNMAMFDAAARREYLTYQVRDASGKVVLHSTAAPAEPFDAPLSTGFHDTPTARIYTEMAADGSLFLQVADRFKNRNEAARESAVTLLIPLAALIPASIFAIWFVVGRALRPIEALRRDIGTKDSGNMVEVDGQNLPVELRPIARSVNLLLGRLRAALEAEREFTANSAHELRTPIAGALAQTQRLAEELPPGPTQDRIQQVEASLVNLSRLAEKLLQLSRAEAGIGGSSSPIDLRPVLDMVVTDFQRDSRTNGRLKYSAAPDAKLVRNADMDAFGIVTRNLIENALIHGDPDLPVNVSLESGGIIRVVNGGPPIREAEMAGLKKRFRRGKTTASGSGLGLAIADRIVSQMGGTLELRSPPAGEKAGFEATMTLPA